MPSNTQKLQPWLNFWPCKEVGVGASLTIWLKNPAAIITVSSKCLSAKQCSACTVAFKNSWQWTWKTINGLWWKDNSPLWFLLENPSLWVHHCLPQFFFSFLWANVLSHAVPPVHIFYILKEIICNWSVEFEAVEKHWRPVTTFAFDMMSHSGDFTSWITS